MIALALQSEKLPPIDIDDPEQVQNRILDYFEFCLQHNMIPGICGMSRWLGVHRDTVHSWKVGDRRKGSEHQRIINQAYTFIEACIVDELMENRMSSSVGIFFLKQYFGYKDRFDVGIGAGTAVMPDPLSDLDPAAAMKRLAEIYLPEGEEGDQIDGNGTGDQGDKAD